MYFMTRSKFATNYFDIHVPLHHYSLCLRKMNCSSLLDFKFFSGVASFITTDKQLK